MTDYNFQPFNSGEVLNRAMEMKIEENNKSLELARNDIRQIDQRISFHQATLDEKPTLQDLEEEVENLKIKMSEVDTAIEEKKSCQGYITEHKNKKDAIQLTINEILDENEKLTRELELSTDN